MTMDCPLCAGLKFKGKDTAKFGPLHAPASSPQYCGLVVHPLNSHRSEPRTLNLQNSYIFMVNDRERRGHISIPLQHNADLP